MLLDCTARLSKKIKRQAFGFDRITIVLLNEK